jgi:hypothetical protein
MYSVSNFGRVMRIVHGRSTYAGKILALNDIGSGYLQVGLRHDGARKMMLVHKAVMLAFGPLQPEGYEVNHKNGNTSDNSYSNLEWITPTDNIHHAFEHHLRQPMKNKRSIHVKLKDGEVWLIKKLLLHHVPQTLIGKMFLVTKQCVWRIAHNKSWVDISYQGGRP